MGFLTPDAPDPKTPARRPERVVEVEPEDVQLGTSSNQEAGSDLRLQGRRSLSRPAGSQPVATGAQV